MDFIPLSSNQIRQASDAATVFAEHARVLARAKSYSGGMYWKRQGAYEYLVKTFTDNRQERLGARSPETEKIYNGFIDNKREVEARLASLRAALEEQERQNKALRVGRVPAQVVSVLQAIEDAGLGAHFTVVGTHALYAYETAAGVRIVQGALATQDVDLLWDARKHVSFVTDLARDGESMLAVLRRADKTFQRKDDTPSTAINDKGFEVDFLRRPPVEGDPHPFHFSGNEDDMWAVQAPRANILTDAPGFSQVVVSATGRMALMRTISPKVFVSFKRWLGTEAPNRPAQKRQRDLQQANIVEALLSDRLLIPEAGNLGIQGYAPTVSVDPAEPTVRPPRRRP